MSIVKQIAESNIYSYNLLKAAEECTELAEVLLKKSLKAGTKKEPDNQSIIDEIGDVQIRLDILKEMFGPDNVNLRIVKKLKKYEEYLQKGEYKTRV